MSNKTTRAKGKRVGVKLMEDAYQPATAEAFDGVRKIANNRLKLRRHVVGQHIEEELDYRDVRDRLARIINVAHTKKDLAKRLLVEAGEHRKKAIAVAKVMQVLPVDVDDYSDDSLEDNPTSEETFGPGRRRRRNSWSDEEAWSEDVRSLIDAALWLQKEHLDVLEVEHWRSHFVQEVTKCITMEACVEMIEKANAKAEELKAFIQEADGDNNTDQNDGATQSP